MTLRILRLFAATALLSLSAPGWADEGAGPLRGEYRFHGQTLIDPPPGEPRDSHLGLMLEGGAARDLYRRMKGRGERDICLDDGSRIKTQGPLRCTELAGKRGWRCVFAIQLDTLTLVSDGAC